MIERKKSIEAMDEYNDALAHASKDNDVAMGDHYVHNNPLETINVMEYLANEWTRNGIAPRIICDLLQVIKYCSSRLGRKGGKDTLADDLLKIENYAHRARTGEWLK